MAPAWQFCNSNDSGNIPGCIRGNVGVWDDSMHYSINHQRPIRCMGQSRIHSYRTLDPVAGEFPVERPSKSGQPCHPITGESPQCSPPDSKAEVAKVFPQSKCEALHSHVHLTFFLRLYSRNSLSPFIKWITLIIPRMSPSDLY
jgi:hypothetical protein